MTYSVRARHPQFGEAFDAPVRLIVVITPDVWTIEPDVRSGIGAIPAAVVDRVTPPVIPAIVTATAIVTRTPSSFRLRTV